MFCNCCGTQLPDDSRFCVKCGNALPATATKPTATTGTGAVAVPAIGPLDDRQRLHGLVEPKPLKRRIAIWFFVPLVVLVIGFLIFSINSNGPQDENPLQRLTATEYTAKLPEENFAVHALGTNSVKFEVPTGAFDVRADGEFTTEGGSGNDIEAYIFDEDGFVNWQNRHDARPYYSSGRVTRGSIKVTLPGPRTYYVVFSNKFSLLSTKNVEAHVTLHYSK